MASEITSAPVLSTPDTHILSEIEPGIVAEPSQRLSDDQLKVRYEIDRTVKEIRQHRWRRVALQFPDHMLSDSARVYQLLARRLRRNTDTNLLSSKAAEVEAQIESLDISDQQNSVKLTILGDTSYGSCCVDEIAAEHVDAEAVVHYGRSCLSPTARLPVVDVFTQMELDHDRVIEDFKKTFPEVDTPVILTADTPYSQHVELLAKKLIDQGYQKLFAASIIHDPSSLIPNRTVPDILKDNPGQLGDYHLFHISDPPTSLLLTLASRMASVHLHSTSDTPNSGSGQSNTSLILRRRYALVTSLTTVSTWGILINTLSVKDYLHIVDHVKSQIANAGKKSYLFVVGKLNAAKIANFAEIGGWVVIGCWESSLIEAKDFYRPIITPYELDLVLAGDQNRVWTGAWRSDFQGILDNANSIETAQVEIQQEASDHNELYEDNTLSEEEESAPPEFDLRTGKYVSHARPMAPLRSRVKNESTQNGTSPYSTSKALTKQSTGEILAVKGVASPAAQFLAEKRTWTGLGSDFEIRYEEDEVEGDLIEEGRTGVASAYAVGDSDRT